MVRQEEQAGASAAPPLGEATLASHTVLWAPDGPTFPKAVAQPGSGAARSPKSGGHVMLSQYLSFPI